MPFLHYLRSALRKYRVNVSNNPIRFKQSSLRLDHSTSLVMFCEFIGDFGEFLKGKKRDLLNLEMEGILEF